MRKSDFQTLTARLQDARNEFNTFMEKFVYSAAADSANLTPRLYMTEDDQRHALDLYRKMRSLEDCWLKFVSESLEETPSADSHYEPNSRIFPVT